jgi:hypothetical protein
MSMRSAAAVGKACWNGQRLVVAWIVGNIPWDESHKPGTAVCGDVSLEAAMMMMS